MVEFIAVVPEAKFARAEIDYGDGKAYHSDDWSDAHANMFWHRYSEPGRYVVSLNVRYTSGVVSSTACSFTLAKPAPPQTTSTTSRPAEASTCHPSYEGACVPIASDVDCSSGSGNGPAYVRGPVYVVGPDVYRLDGNNDGVGCENG